MKKQLTFALKANLLLDTCLFLPFQLSNWHPAHLNNRNRCYYQDLKFVDNWYVSVTGKSESFGPSKVIVSSYMLHSLAQNRTTSFESSLGCAGPEWASFLKGENSRFSYHVWLKHDVMRIIADLRGHFCVILCLKTLIDTFVDHTFVSNILYSSWFGWSHPLYEFNLETKV